MALKEITDHILKDAEKKASGLKSEAREKSQAVLREAGRQAEGERRRILFEEEKKAEEERKRIIAMSRLEARNAVLTAKQNRVQAVFDQALKSLTDLPEKEYLQVLRDMLKRAAKEGEEVILSEKDSKRVTLQFLSEVNPSLKLARETRKISGGFILKSGRIESNYTFEALISAARGETEPEVLKILFGS